ncbi:MAG: tyrosine-protein phosphatase [Erysipelotrichaceae bacterium]|nr:tyrosine-protein phosphatase [Erysipelotrichaceae bacterium]
MKLANVNNFRELGGYVTKDGRHIKHGYLYRSAGLNRVQKEDKEQLAPLHIQYVIDFRESETVKAQPDVLLDGMHYDAIPALIENEYTQSRTLNFFDLLHGDMSEEEIVESNAFLKEAYLMMPFGNPAFQRVFELMKQQAYPILFHCSGGKDRTGLMAALILDLLGVDWDTILQDYMKSNAYIGKDGYVDQQLQLKNITDPALVDIIWKTVGVQEMYLETAFAKIREVYGTMERYYEKEYGLGVEEIQAIRDFYLE